MHRQDLRVLVAAESHDVRELFKRVVRAEGGAVVMGEAENVAAVVTMSQNIKPDVVLLDACLPYVNRNDLPLSRVGGLDTAQAIGAQLSGARAVLVTNMDSPSNLSPDLTGQLFRHEAGKRIPFTLHELYDGTSVQFPVFADIESIPWTGDIPDTVPHLMVPFSKEAVYFGGIGLVMGGATSFTVVFAPVGVVIAAAGACAILFGLTSKLLNRLMRRRHLSRTARE